MADLTHQFPRADHGAEESESATLLDRIAGGELRNVTLNMAGIDALVSEFDALSDGQKSAVFKYMLLDKTVTFI